MTDQISAHNKIFYATDESTSYNMIRQCIMTRNGDTLGHEHVIPIETSKMSYNMRISDTHYEVDIMLLGCNHKQLWDEIFVKIHDIIRSKPVGSRCGTVVARGFQHIHPDLHDVFYGYIQRMRHDHCVDISFYLQTTCISFIHRNILDSCEHVNVKKRWAMRDESNSPISKKSMCTPPSPLRKSLSSTKMKELVDSDNASYDIYNIMHVKTCNELVDVILTDYTVSKDIPMVFAVRDKLYDMMFMCLDPHMCMWCVVCSIIEALDSTDCEVFEMVDAYTRCFSGFNTNYRPIYHLERFIICMIRIVHFPNKDVATVSDEFEFGIDKGLWDIESPLTPTFPTYRS